MHFHSILITVLSPLHTITLLGTYHCWHDDVLPRLFTLHESVHILLLLLASTTKTVAMYKYFSFISVIVSYRVALCAMRIVRVLPLLLHQVLVQYQYLLYIVPPCSCILYRYSSTKQSTNKSTNPDNRHYCAYCACAALIRRTQFV